MAPYHEQVQDVFRDVFDDPSLILKDEMTADDIIGWDSLAHINLIIAIERRLRVRFATAEISRLKENGANIGSLLDLVARKRRSSA
jgi:acyl carrier protein